MVVAELESSSLIVVGWIVVGEVSRIVLTME